MRDVSYQPDWFSRPGDTLAALMARQNLTNSEVADQVKTSPEMISNILLGRTAIDSGIAAALSMCVGGSSTFWIKRQQAYDAALSRIAESIDEEAAANWLREFSPKVLAQCGLSFKSKSKREALKMCLAFFGVTGPEDWEKRYASFPGDVAFRNSNAYRTVRSSLAAWLRLGEIEAAKIQTGSWDANNLRDRLSDLRKLSKWKSPLNFVPVIRTICASAGVSVVFVRAPQGCRASGASRFISSDKAMVVLSFRHLTDDHFWFTFFHEIGHLLLHGKETTFVDQDDTEKNDREHEANMFASCALIPLEKHEELFHLSARYTTVVRFAVSLGISPGIVVGQMQHHGIVGPEKLNFLKRRYDWSSIEAAFANP